MILIALKIKLLGALQLNMEEMSVLTMKRELEKNGEEIINSMAKQVLYEFSSYSFGEGVGAPTLPRGGAGGGGNGHVLCFVKPLLRFVVAYQHAKNKRKQVSALSDLKKNLSQGI